MSEYTPTTAEVRERFVDGFPMDTWALARDECALDFDRWLAEHDRRHAVKALRDAAGQIDASDAVRWLRAEAARLEAALNPKTTKHENRSEG